MFLTRRPRGRRSRAAALRQLGLVLGVYGGLLGVGIATAGATAAGAAAPPGPKLVARAPAAEHLAAGPYAGSEPSADEASVLAPAINDQPQSPRRLRWFARAGLSAAYRWAFDESMFGAALEGELGGQDPRLAGGMRLRLEFGKMLTGLAYQVVSLGPFIWLPTVRERVHIGVGLDAGALLISRKTMPGSTLWSILMGGQLRVSIDMLRIGPTGALQADAGVAVQALTLAPGPLTIATTLGLGYRP